MFDSLKIKFRDYICFVPIIACGLYFYFLFIRCPVIGDRLMESWAVYDLQDPWRVLFTHVRWIQKANLRVLSNLFSIIVDSNIYLRACCNSLMLMGICYIISKPQIGSGLFKTTITVLLMSMVGYYVQQEVYLYSTTLYISSILIILLFIEYTTNYQLNLKSVLLIVFGSMWLEIVLVAMVTIIIMRTLINYEHFRYNNLGIQDSLKKCRKDIYICITGVSVFFADAFYLYFIASARYNTVASNTRNGMFELVKAISGLLFVFVFVWGLYVKRFVSGKCKVLFLLCAIIGLFVFGILICDNILNIILLEFDCELPFGWKHFDFVKLSFFFEMGRKIIGRIVFLLFVFYVIVLISFLLENNERMIIGAACLIVCSLFSTLVFSSAGRISSVYVFAIVFLIVHMLDRIISPSQQKKTFDMINCKKMVVGHYFLMFIIIFIFFYSIMEYASMNMLVNMETKVFDERHLISSKVRELQLMNEWDYDRTIVMPKYITTVDGKHLFNQESDSPKIGTTRYEILLRYYDLNENTKIVFK